MIGMVSVGDAADHVIMIYHDELLHHGGYESCPAETLVVEWSYGNKVDWLVVSTALKNISQPTNTY